MIEHGLQNQFTFIKITEQEILNHGPFSVKSNPKTNEVLTLRYNQGKATLHQACNFVKKEILAQVFSCEFCKILKTPFLQNTSGPLLLSMVIDFIAVTIQHPSNVYHNILFEKETSIEVLQSASIVMKPYCCKN